MKKKEIIKELEYLKSGNRRLDREITELIINTHKTNVPIINKDGNPIMLTYATDSYYYQPTGNKTETLKLKDVVEAILNHLNLEVKKVEDQSTIVLKERKE